MSSRRSSRKSRNNGYSGYSDNYDEPEFQQKEEFEDDGDDQSNGEVTRCICGNQELLLDPSDKYYNDEKVLGLFIQCDECNVWQHGYCVSIYEEKQVPEKYWCETCHPELHHIEIGPHGSSSYYLPVQPKKNGANGANNVNGSAPSAAKRKQRSSRSTSGSKNELETDFKTTPTRSKRSTINSNNDDVLEKVLRQSAKEFKSANNENLESDKETGEKEAKAGQKPAVKNESDEAASDSNTAGTEDSNKKPDEDSKRKPVRKPEPKKQPARKRSEPPSDGGSDASKVSRKKKIKINENGSKKPNGKHVKSNSTNGSAKSSSNGNSNSLVLDSDKPIEPRIPPSRITLHEMRKRITAISEYIFYVQADLSEEHQQYEKMLGHLQQKSTGNSANTSSANMSLEDDDSVEEEKFIKDFQTLFAHHHSGSMEMTHSLQRKIQSWEESFGSYES